jgi:hypothetical protein
MPMLIKPVTYLFTMSLEVIYSFEPHRVKSHYLSILKTVSVGGHQEMGLELPPPVNLAVLGYVEGTGRAGMTNVLKRNT